MSDWEPTEPIPPRIEIDRGKTAAGGYTKATLASWGVPWPPPKGWLAKLERASDIKHGSTQFRDLSR